MKVTAVKQQLKRTNRYSIYVDGAYSFSLGEGQLIDSGLHSGQEVTEQQVDSFRQQSDSGKLFDKILNLLSYRPRSEWEIVSYLKRKKVTDEQISELIERCQNLGYINDQRFAKQWVENRRFGKPMSRRKLRSELMAKRISSQLIDQVLANDANQTNEADLLRQLVEKKRHRYPDTMKFMQYLARQGFSYDDIKTALAAES